MTPFEGNELVVALEINHDARAYSCGIMNWHEIVNDTVGGIPVTIISCPLCDTMLVHERYNTTFGVSGKLFQSCLVMYDRTDDTLYSQPWGDRHYRGRSRSSTLRASSGKDHPREMLTKHPDSQILSTRTGYSRNYLDYPYGSYLSNRTIIFQVRHQHLLDGHPKTIISYIWHPDEKNSSLNHFTGISQAVTHEFDRKKQTLEVSYGKDTAMASWNPEVNTVLFHDRNRNRIISSTAFAFVYPAFFNKPIDEEKGA